jgi:hypothetical protein
LDIFLRGFSLSGRSQHSLKALLLCLKHVLNCEQIFFPFLIFLSGLSGINIDCNRISEGSLYSLA